MTDRADITTLIGLWDSMVLRHTVLDISLSMKGKGGGGVNMLYLVNEQNLKLKRIFFDISKKGRITNIKKGSWKFS